MRSALVTGGSDGIGLAIARMLAEEGFALTLAARGAERLDAAASELRATGADVQVVSVDLTAAETVAQVASRHGERFGALDVLVNNAGVGLGQPLAEITAKRVDVQLGLNLRTTIVGYRECLPLLREAVRARGGAFVVNTASAAALDGQAWLSVYSAAKAGVVAFTEAMNKELAAEGIRSCALCPSTVDTPLTAYLDGDRSGLLRPEDLAEVVRMLLRVSPSCLISQVALDLIPGR